MKKEEIYDLLINSENIGAFVDGCAQLIDNPMWIMDTTYQVLAHSSIPSAVPFIQDFMTGNTVQRVQEWLENGTFEALKGHKEPVRLHDEYYDSDMLIMDIYSGSNQIGKMTIVLKNPIEDAVAVWISQAASVYLRQQDVTVRSTFGQALSFLLLGTEEAETVGLQILNDGFYIGKPPYIIANVVHAQSENLTVLNVLLNDVRKRNPQILGAVVHGHCYFLLSNGESLPEDLLTSDFRVGYSMAFQELHALQGYAQQAVIATQLADGKNVSFQDHYGDYIRYCFAEQTKQPETFVLPQLKRVLHYDAEYHTEYYKTLKCYLLCSLSKKKTAEKLDIHLNTVKYRISQLEKLFSIDFEDYDALYVSLLAVSACEQSDASKTEK